MIPSGVAMYSKEWWNIISSKHNLPPQHELIVREMCESIQAGNEHDVVHLSRLLSKYEEQLMDEIKEILERKR